MTDFRHVLLAGLLLVASMSAADAAPISITGEVTYRERIALPDDVTLSVQLIDTSLADAPAKLHAEAQINGPGQVPLQFNLSFDDKLIVKNHSYALVAEIYTGDALLFRNTTNYPIDPLAPAQPVVVVVNFVGTFGTDAPPEKPLGEVEYPPVPLEPVPAAALYGTVWHLAELAGFSVSTNVDTTLSITEDGRAGGRGGCNNYFAQAVFDGNAIGFGAVAATKMACGTAEMAQESAFFAALPEARSFEVDGMTVIVRDADQNLLIRLTGTAP